MMSNKSFLDEMPQLPKVPREARVRAILMPTIPEHVVIVSKDVLHKLAASDGEELRAEYRGRRARVVVRAGVVPANRAELHPNDLKALGISQGTDLFLIPYDKETIGSRIPRSLGH